ncbi:hypothetical protein QQ045_011182 [Rhodiola kirilowii]
MASCSLAGTLIRLGTFNLAKRSIRKSRTTISPSSRPKLELWLQQGDHNSRLFHASIKARRAKNKINLHLGDDNYTNDREVIRNAAMQFYRDLFGGYNPPPPMRAFAIFDPVIREEDNEVLCSFPSSAEVHEIILGMNMDSSPGLDGFTGHFYSHCWEVIKGDLMEVITGFFGGLTVPSAFSSTFITLLPKVPNATAIDQLRPISLCNFCHKIISRILASRLAPWLPKIISEEQVGFIQGRNIHENIALAHDLSHDLNHKTFGGNIIFKLDISKAYDRISWSFILRTFRSLGFSDRWCDMIYRCISNCMYSIKWDGQLYGFFRSTRGVCQGDPLSPSLFVVAMEWFSRVMKAGDQFGVLKPYITKRPSIRINHLLFADDLLIFTNGAKDSLNSSKSILIFPKVFASKRKTDLLSLSKFSEGSLPQPYLGAPLYRGRTTIDLFDGLVDKVDARIGGWATHLLSIGGWVTLCNSVLMSIGIHAMMVLSVPATSLSRIASRIANFIWDSDGTKHRHWRNREEAFKKPVPGRLVGETRWWLGTLAPSHLAQLPIRVVTTSSELLRDLLTALLARESTRCLWQNESGFSTKAFRSFAASSKDLLWFLDKVLPFGESGLAYNIQSSHSTMTDLAGVGDETCPVEIIYARRRLSQKYGIIAFFKICAKANGPALSLAYSVMNADLIKVITSHPKATQIALTSDLSGLSSMCHGDCFSHRTILDASCDDCPLRGTFLPSVVFQDDSRV